MQMVVYCLVFSLHFVGNVIYVSLLLPSPSSVDLFNVYNQIVVKLYVVLSWFTVHNPFVVLFSFTQPVCFLSGFHDLYVVLFWFTQSVCCFILAYTICMWFYLGLHNLYVVLAWFTESVCGLILVYTVCMWFYLGLHNL